MAAGADGQAARSVSGPYKGFKSSQPSGMWRGPGRGGAGAVLGPPPCAGLREGPPHSWVSGGGGSTQEERPEA